MASGGAAYICTAQNGSCVVDVGGGCIAPINGKDACSHGQLLSNNIQGHPSRKTTILSIILLLWRPCRSHLQTSAPCTQAPLHRPHATVDWDETRPRGLVGVVTRLSTIRIDNPTTSFPPRPEVGAVPPYHRASSFLRSNLRIARPLILESGRRAGTTYQQTLCRRPSSRSDGAPNGAAARWRYQCGYQWSCLSRAHAQVHRQGGRVRSGSSAVLHRLVASPSLRKTAEALLPARGAR